VQRECVSPGTTTERENQDTGDVLELLHWRTFHGKSCSIVMTKNHKRLVYRPLAETEICRRSVNPFSSIRSAGDRSTKQFHWMTAWAQWGNGVRASRKRCWPTSVLRGWQPSSEPIVRQKFSSVRPRDSGNEVEYVSLHQFLTSQPRQSAGDEETHPDIDFGITEFRLSR